MANSKSLAGLLGPALIAVCISEALNLDIWANVTAPVVYLNGTLLFVAGLAIVRAHNCWKPEWPILVTLMGWFIMLGGLIRMFAPDSARRAVQISSTPVYALLIVLLAIGVFLTFKAYGRE